MNHSTCKNNNHQSGKLQISSGVWKIGLLMVGLMIVAGCGNNTPQAGSSPSTTQSESNIVEPTVTETVPATTEQESSPSTDSASEESTANNATDNSSTSSISAQHILAAAQEGTLPDLPKGLSLGSSRETLFQLQGKPKLGNAEDPMLSYGTLDVSFDPKDNIVEMTSSAKAYDHLKMSAIITALGKPDNTNDTSKDVAHTAEATYQLTSTEISKYFLVFSYQTQTQKIQYVRLYKDIQ